MNIRKKKIGIIISVLILLMLVFPTIVEASMSGQTPKVLVNRNGQEYPKNFINADYPYFCIKHGFPVKLKKFDADGNPSEALAYKEDSKSEDIEPSVGYAAYCLKRLGFTQKQYKEEMQDIIWSSNQWGNESNMLSPGSKGEGMTAEDFGRDFSYTVSSGGGGTYYSSGTFPLRTRSYTYGTVYYGILGTLPSSGETTSLFTVTPANEVSSDDLKIVVDQTTGQYTVGPYKLKINATAVSGTSPDMSLAKKALYAELTKNNNTKGYVNIGYNDKIKFAWFDIGNSDFFSGLNGTDQHFVDTSGRQIEFPNFVDEEEFYIRFKPNNDGAIVTTGTPKVTIKYLTRFPGTYKKYTDGEFVRDTIKVRITRSSAPPIVNFHNFTVTTWNGGGGWSTDRGRKRYEAYVLCDITLNSSTKGGNSYTTHIKNIKLKMYRYQYYTDHEDRDGDGNDDHWKFPTNYNQNEYYYEGGMSAFYLTIEDIHVTTERGTNVKISGPGCVATTGDVSIDASSGPSTKDNVQDLIRDLNVQSGGGNGLFDVSGCWASASFVMAGKDINMQIGGHVFLDVNDVKDNKPNGRYTSYDAKYGGVEVKLYESGSNSLIATTTTDNDGQYRFYGLSGGKPLINPLLKYYVTYTYNGQLYQQTYYKEGGNIGWTGGYSNAKENNRSGFNNKFETIYSEPANYDSWHKSFALDQKLERSDQTYISYGNRSDNSGSGNYLDLSFSKEEGALTYGDAWNHFIKIATYSGSAGLPEMGSTSGSNPKYTDGRLNWDRSKNYSSVYNDLKDWLTTIEGVDSTEADRVIQYIKDCQITSKTIQSYPIYDKFVLGERSKDIEHANSVSDTKETIAGIDCYYLYNNAADQSRWVDFGINRRVNEDLALQKDVYKATVIVNGKKEEYIYNKKDLSDDGLWQIDMRASDVLYNGSKIYSREIRRSEYLYDGSDATGRSEDDAKNMQVFVTYRLAVKNMGSVDAKVRELVDYYDTTQYDYDGVLDADDDTNKKSYNEYDAEGNISKTYINSFIGSDHKGGRIYEEETGYTATEGWKNDQLVVKSTGMKHDDPEGRNKEKLTGTNYDYTSLYLTGESGALLVSHTAEDGTKSVDDTLHPGEILYVYLTFKVKEDTTYNRVKIDQDLNTAEFTLGKRNIAEINCYSTYYKSGDTIPDYLDSSDGTHNEGVGGKTAGIVDVNSNPGSLTTKDLYSDNVLDDDGKIIHYAGDIITDKDNRVNDRQQNDTDKAPNIRLIIGGEKGDDVRTVSGLVYEDARNTASGDAVVGDGVYGSGDTIINGVTLQLVELVQVVDADGISKHTYKGEKVWVQHEYTSADNYKDPTRTYQYETNNKWYYSGTGHAYIIINGDGPVLNVSEDEVFGSAGEIEPGDGKYIFASMPAGDFYVRFIYGKDDKTALTNGTVTGKDVNTLTGLSGLNAKSYNGQDYKSTTYQTGIDQTDVIVDKSGTTESSYNNIELYKRTGDSVATGDTNNKAQNYARTDYNLYEDDTIKPHASQIQFNYNEYGVNNTNINYYDNLDISDSATLYEKTDTYNTDVVYAGIPSKTNMYYYDIERADLNGKNVSDAKDVWYYRDRSNEWSKGINANETISGKLGYKQSLLNNRSEILRSFDHISTYQTAKKEDNAALQTEMIRTLEEQTYGVAATGIINTEVERNTEVVGGTGDEYEYKAADQITGGDGTESRTSADSAAGNRNSNVYAIKDIDLGLVERPEAQIKINKEVSNFKIVLANNQVLFDASSSVKNLYFAKHEGHHVYNSTKDSDKAAAVTSKNETLTNKRLAGVAVSSNTKATPELLQTYIDDELTEGATMQVTYKYTLQNVGEVDYLDKQFYYTGVTNNGDQANVSRTNTHTVVDYVTNMLKYDPAFQVEGTGWDTWGVNTGFDSAGKTLDNGLTNSTKLVTTDGVTSKYTNSAAINKQYAISMLDQDYVNRQYHTEISTYNTLLTTHNLSGELLPVRYNHGSSSTQTSLVLSTKLSSNNTGDNLIYNNLTEAIETTNTVGRRMQYSIVGNQEMSDQSLGNNASSDVYTSLDLVTPTEIDADSAQKIVLMPPTGEDRDYLPIIITSITAVAIIAIAVVLIKTKVLNKNKK